MTDRTVIKALTEEKHFVRLMDNLRRQVKGFDKYIETARRLKMALINNNLKENIEINVQQDGITTELERLERERLAEMAQIAGLLKTRLGKTGFDKAPGDVHCTDLYPFLSEGDEQELAGLRETLRSRLAEARSLHEINAILIGTARKVTQATVTVMTGLADRREKEISQVYGAKGGLSHTPRQKIRLLNKKA